MKHVYLLWALIAGVFIAFNAVYWPVVRHQTTLDPANFVARAEMLHARGLKQEAIVWLQQGIATQRPPISEPYRLLQVWLEAQGQEAAAREIAPKRLFYEALEEPDTQVRGRLLQQAVSRTLAHEPAPALSPATGQAVDAMSGFLAGIFGIEETISGWSLGEKTALLRISGGPILPERRIGETGVVSPVDLLAISGGGDGQRRTAQLCAGARHYVGTERGLHVMVIEPDSGDVLHLMTFDLWQREEEAGRLTAFLRDIAPGSIALFAVLDNAAGNWSKAMKGELIAFGLREEAVIGRQPALLGDRYSFAAIGVKGAPPGTAIQAWSPDQFADVLGHPVAVGVVEDQSRKAGS